MEKWEENELLLQAAGYFKKPGFLRLFRGLKERYKTLSRVGGNVCLKKLTREEAEALEGFLQKPFSEGNRLSVSIPQIRKALANTRYDQCALEDLIPLVLEETMVSNKEEKIKKESEKAEFFNQILELCPETPAGTWLKEGLSKNSPLRKSLIKDYHGDKQWLEENIPLVLSAINRLPTFEHQYLHLPVFSASVTGNPHYFDEGKKGLNYLINAIRSLFGTGKIQGNTSEARAELLYQAGILKEDLYNWVLCSGIRGYVSEGELHGGMEEYLKNGESQILTLQNLSYLKSVSIDSGKVYVVENPSVFAWIVEKKETSACICSGGQLRLSVLVLLDLLVKEGVTIYYSGDFDPEGLSIAQKLVSRYGNSLKLWCYDPEIYYKSMSSETISEKRLKQLARLTDDTLVELAGLLMEYRHSGYQENVLDCLLPGELLFSKFTK